MCGSLVQGKGCCLPLCMILLKPIQQFLAIRIFTNPILGSNPACHERARHDSAAAGANMYSKIGRLT
jgi:hypothetical protein